MHQKPALILSGGGARGAYQVGVLKGLSEILKSQKIDDPFKILSGNSAGAINTAYLAASDENFSNSVEKLVYLWSQLHHENVFKTDLLSAGKFSLTSLMGFSTNKNFFQFNSLLNTAPLKELIEKNCDFSNIQKNLDQQRYESVLITANNYNQGGAHTFIQTPSVFDNKRLNWGNSRFKPVRTTFQADHVLASSSIPLLFPPVRIDDEYYGDGCVRNTSPCGPSVRLGASKLFVIGVRTMKDTPSTPKPVVQNGVSLIGILNTLLNAVLMDSVEQDVSRIQKINQIINSIPRNTVLKNTGLKNIPVVFISPSSHLAELARERAHKLPRILRMTISAVGELDEASEIMSYLMFETDYCKKLIEIGYHDALAAKKEIIHFFSDDNSTGFTAIDTKGESL